MSEFNQVRDQLIDMLEELEHRLERITTDVRHTEKPLHQDLAVESENDPPLEDLEESTVREIEQIRQTLSLIEEGEYGICRQCGQPINKKHLQTLPYTSLCIHCTKTER